MINWLCTTHIKTGTIMQNWNKQKKCTAKFARTKRKKGEQTQGKKPTQRKKLFWLNTYWECSSMRANLHHRAWQVRNKPGQRRRHEFREIETADGNFLNKKNDDFNWCTPGVCNRLVPFSDVFAIFSWPHFGRSGVKLIPLALVRYWYCDIGAWTNEIFENWISCFYLTWNFFFTRMVYNFPNKNSGHQWFDF